MEKWEWRGEEILDEERERGNMNNPSNASILELDR